MKHIWKQTTHDQQKRHQKNIEPQVKQDQHHPYPEKSILSPTSMAFRGETSPVPIKDGVRQDVGLPGPGVSLDVVHCVQWSSDLDLGAHPGTGHPDPWWGPVGPGALFNGLL